VPVEQTDAGRERVAVRAVPEAGRSCGAIGEDVVAGAVVLTAGTVLRAPQIGLAAAVGLPGAAGAPPAGGAGAVDRLGARGAGCRARAGADLRVERPMLAAAVEEAGGRAELLRFVPDDVEQFLGRLRERIGAVEGGVDLVLTSGGVSAGAYEVVKDAFTGRGVDFVRGGDAARRAAGRRPGRRARRRRGGDAAGQPR
jgi:molybdopterin molybdotransferase